MRNRDIAVALHQLKGVGTGILTQIDRLVNGDWQQLTGGAAEEVFLKLQVPKALIPFMVEQLHPDRIKQVVEGLDAAGIKAVMLGEEEYPSSLKEIANPPFLLYGLGDLSLLSEPNAIAIVGTRTPSSYGQMVAHRLAADLAEAGWLVISGMASGIDSCAHRGALAARGKTIAVLGNGVDIVYPKENHKLYEEIRQRGLLLSEYPPGMQPERGLFPQRNRIISGLSRGVVVVECHQKSGSLITAAWAAEQGKEVFAVPGPILSAKSTGPHQLIKEGAKLVTSARDILDEFSYTVARGRRGPNGNKEELSDEERQVLEVISYTQIHIDEILRSLNQPPGHIHKILLSLEAKKKIVKLPGFFYIKR